MFVTMFSNHPLLYTFSAVLITTLIVTIAFFKRRYRYWKDLGVEYVEPTLPFGNAVDTFFRKKSMGEWFSNFYEHLKAKNAMHGGSYFFHRHCYVPIDLDLIKHIMQIDFVHFTDHGSFYNEKDDPLSAHLFSLDGQKWRSLRIKLTPTFTSGKMKNMFRTLVEISKELIKVLNQESEGETPVEAKDISARFTTDIIGSCAFGIDCNSLEDPSMEFRVKGRRVFKLTFSENMQNFIWFLFPDFMKFLGARLLPKEATDFFWNLIKKTTEYREQSGVRRNDFLQLLLDMTNKEGIENENTLTYNEMAPQAFVFFLAGFETSSSLMSFALLELAINEEIQNKLREEVNTVMEKNNNELTYDSVADMQYLDMVIHETLRKYPPLPVLQRVCTKDYRVPNTNVTISKGDAVFIPILGIHYDSDYYPDPQKFDPMRFNEENRSKRHQFAYLPFGEGPRICIGLRFGLMQAKVGLAMVIKNFKVKVNPQTEQPVKMDPTSFLTSSLGGLWLDFEKIN